MIDWADDIASRVLHSPTDIASALRSERLLGKQGMAEKDAQIAHWQSVARDRLKTLKAERKARGE